MWCWNLDATDLLIIFFTVTMQAQNAVPSDFVCKDKFLIQSTIVPKGTKEEHITSTTVVIMNL